MPIDRPMPREWRLLLAVFALAALALGGLAGAQVAQDHLVPARQNAAKLPARAA